MHTHSPYRYTSRGFGRPRPEPAPASIVFVSESRSADDAALRGGDVFDVCVRANGSATALLADVSSKGPRAVVHTEMMRRAFRTLAAFEQSPARIMETLNGLRFNGPGPSLSITFASAIVVAIDRSTAICRYASAGHDVGLLVSGHAHRHLTPTGPVLGVFEDPTYTDCIEPFDSETLLLLASDGFTECRDRGDATRHFGTAGLVRALHDTPATTCRSAASAVTARADAFTGGRYVDDATVAVIARSPAIGSPQT